MDKPKWYFVDITTNCHRRIAIKAHDESEAEEYAQDLVDTGTVDPTDTCNYDYGSADDTFTATDEGIGDKPPFGMYRFEKPTE